jgi:hypothetical protein
MCKHTYIILDDLPGPRLIICKDCGFVPAQETEFKVIPTVTIPTVWTGNPLSPPYTITTSQTYTSNGDDTYYIWLTN